MRNFNITTHLERQNIVLSWRRYGIDALNGMTLGLFSSLIIGLILKNIGTWANIAPLVNVGTHAQAAVGAAIGAGVAFGLKAPPLVLFASVATGLVGAELGGVVGALVAVVVGAEIGKLFYKTAPIDIIITPAITLITGVTTAQLIAPAISSLMTSLGDFISWSMALSPILMSIVIAIAMGMLLTLPISSAAIAISLGLSDLSAGAATVGCAAQMIGFAAMSYRDNGISGIISQGLGTSMIQMPNILKNPYIWLPTILAGAILAPIATVIFGMTNIPIGAGMGTSGLVGQVGTIEAMGASVHTLMLIVLFHVILPAILTLAISRIMRRKGLIKDGDLTLTNL
ncbi:PTS sugar transporter subunit IIC [Moraxella haemolytica]|uniref:PTS transporter subunit IIC n=1 Tax=Moraxella TaxID=475 RepID=UPI002543418D|nr:PTS sugar transporter subunit IIC [Moraxella sp. ZY171148]WII95108.1 PTS sugar transporter subunit IIC [Moraxella sp. ZY171148]